ncbi:MAG: hypothetical protein ACLP7A_14420 [Desulfobaccales bacterium]
MKLLSINLARSLWFFNLLEINPKGLNLYPIIIPILVDSYKFKQYPSVNDVVDETKGVKFEYGEFINRGGNALIINMTIFNDGITAETRSSTNDSDAFLTEILTRLSQELQLPFYKEILRKICYASQVYVTTNKALELINPKVKEISKYLSNNASGFEEISFELGGLTFWPDQKYTNKPFNFIFERILNVPFSENKYYSAAPLSTDKHLELLNKLERILSK